jgi:hypothetical protein
MPVTTGEPSREARQLAAAVLEVLAGMQAPSEAAGAVGVSLARYYQLEGRALAGLVAACEGRRRGRGQAAGSELARLRQECERLRRECARQQALVRAARRTVGLSEARAGPTPAVPTPTTTPAANARPRRRRRPKARGLKMAAQLRAEATGEPPPAPADAAGPDRPPEPCPPGSEAPVGPTGAAQAP